MLRNGTAFPTCASLWPLSEPSRSSSPTPKSSACATLASSSTPSHSRQVRRREAHPVMSDLAWLRDPPPDFRARVNALKNAGAGAEAGLELLRLASYRLDENQLAKLASVAKVLSGKAPQFTPVKVALVGD